MLWNESVVKLLFYRQREREEQDEGDKDNPKKRRRRNNGTTRSANGQSASAMEAMEKVIHVSMLVIFSRV